MNAPEQMYLIWDLDENEDHCTWSPIVSCNTKPKSISAIVESFLHELLDDKKKSLKMCELKQSDSLSYRSNDTQLNKSVNEFKTKMTTTQS